METDSSEVSSAQRSAASASDACHSTPAACAAGTLCSPGMTVMNRHDIDKRVAANPQQGKSLASVLKLGHPSLLAARQSRLFSGLSVQQPAPGAHGSADRCSALCQTTPWRTRRAASVSCSLRGWPALPAPPSPRPPPGPPGPLLPPSPPSSATGVEPETARASAGRGRARGACAAGSPSRTAQRAGRQPRQARLPGRAWIRISCRRLKGPNHRQKTTAAGTLGRG
jgi:hypothetical protein